MAGSEPVSAPTGLTLEMAVRLGALLVLTVWCFQIVQPFVIPVVWGGILAVLLYPAYAWGRDRLGGRRRLTATLCTLLAFGVLLVPAGMFATTLVSFARDLAHQLEGRALSIPPPPEAVAALPLVGAQLEAAWSSASTNLQGALHQVAPQLGALLRWVLTAAAGTGLGILEFALAIVVSGLFLANTEPAVRAAQRLGERLAGDRGLELVELAGATLRSVAQGILGVALIQSLLAGAGLLAAGVPGAGFWTLLVLLLAIVQLPTAIVLLPVAIYVFSSASPFVAVAFLVWSIAVSLLDNVLKPLLLGRGVRVPMLVIFVGSIGGLLASGFLGLFVGAVVLAIAYELVASWLAEDATDAADA